MTDTKGPHELTDSEVKRKNTPQGKPILRSEIVNAQEHTMSNTSAAKYLGVPYKRYKRYAELYGLFESHMNEKGIGCAKGFAKHPSNKPLRDVLANKHPNYSRAKLRNRLIARKKLEEKCALCGFGERRMTDNKVPLILSHKDGDNKNYNLSNLELLCYNCMFLTTGAPTVVYRSSIERSFDGTLKEKSKTIVPDIRPSDYYDKWGKKAASIELKDINEDDEAIPEVRGNTISIQNQEQLIELEDIELSPEDIQEIQNELMKE